MHKKRLLEILARKTEIRGLVDTADTATLEALSTELDALDAEERQLNQRAGLSGRLDSLEDNASGAGEPDATQERAKRFKSSGGRISVPNVRSLLMSSGNLAAPTEVSQQIVGAFNTVSSIVDLVHVTNAEGWGAYKVAYEESGSSAAAHTEGATITASDPTTKYVQITPASYAVLSKVSNQVRRYTPIDYEGFVQERAVRALRKKLAAQLTTVMLASTLNATQTAALNETYLRAVVLGYGGDDDIQSQAYLQITKADLATLGAVRGTSDKKPVYDITPDVANPNIGIIKDGGLSVKYVLNSNLTTGKQIYGSLLDSVDMGIFSPYNIQVLNERYADEGMVGIVGDVDMGANVVKYHGLVTVSQTSGSQTSSD